MISLMKIATTSLALYGCFSGLKWFALMRQSTTIVIELYPLDRGRPSIKFILSSSQIPFKMGSRCRSLRGDNAFVLFL